MNLVCFGNANYSYDSFVNVKGELFTMNIQLYNHNITVSRIAKILGSEEVARKYLSQCIYVSDMGHNDYLNNYFLDDYNSSKLYTPEEYAQLLIETYETQLEVSPT
jgi:hypothetical protein